jgi:hypothetical protein
VVDVLQHHGDALNADATVAAAVTSRLIWILERLNDDLLTPILFGCLEMTDRARISGASRAHKDLVERLMIKGGSGGREADWVASESKYVLTRFEDVKALRPYVERLRKLRIEAPLTARVCEAIHMNMTDLDVEDAKLEGLTAITTTTWPKLRRLVLRGDGHPGMKQSLFHNLFDFIRLQLPNQLEVLVVGTLTGPFSRTELPPLFRSLLSRPIFASLVELSMPLILANDDEWSMLGTAAPNLTRLRIPPFRHTGHLAPPVTITLKKSTFELIARQWPNLEELQLSLDMRGLEVRWQVGFGGLEPLTRGCPSLRILRFGQPEELGFAFGLQTAFEFCPHLEELELGLHVWTKQLLDVLNKRCPRLRRTYNARINATDSLRVSAKQYATFVHSHPDLEDLPTSVAWSSALLRALAQRATNVEEISLSPSNKFVADEKEASAVVAACRRADYICMVVAKLSDAAFQALVQPRPLHAPPYWTHPMRPLIQLYWHVTEAVHISRRALESIATACPLLENFRVDVVEGKQPLEGAFDVTLGDLTQLLKDCSRLEELSLAGAGTDWKTTDYRPTRAIPLAAPITAQEFDAFRQVTRPAGIATAVSFTVRDYPTEPMLPVNVPPNWRMDVRDSEFWVTMYLGAPT